MSHDVYFCPIFCAETAAEIEIEKMVAMLAEERDKLLLETRQKKSAAELEIKKLAATLAAERDELLLETHERKSFSITMGECRDITSVEAFVHISLHSASFFHNRLSHTGL